MWARRNCSVRIMQKNGTATDCHGERDRFLRSHPRGTTSNPVETSNLGLAGGMDDTLTEVSHVVEPFPPPGAARAPESRDRSHPAESNAYPMSRGDWRPRCPDPGRREAIRLSQVQTALIAVTAFRSRPAR
jgi:hypothetical protein